MKFPKGQLLILSVKPEFIHFDNLFNISKRHRAFNASIYVTIMYGEYTDIILIKGGAVVGTFRHYGDKITPINQQEIVKKANATDSGLVNGFIVDDVLLNMMLTSFTQTPKQVVTFEETSPEDFIKSLEQQKFSGFLLTNKGIENNYTLIHEGEIKYTMFIKNISEQRQDFIDYLNQNRDIVRVLIFEEVPEGIDQATPAQIELFIKIFNHLFKEFGKMLGGTLVLKLISLSLRKVSTEYSFFNNFTIDPDLNFIGSAVVSKEELIQGFARFFNLLMDSLGTVSLGRHEEIVKRVMRDYRFVLDELDFFKHIKISI